MFKIVLKNVGKDMVNKDFIVTTSRIEDATCSAYVTCKDVLGRDKKIVFSVVGEEINITVDGGIVGSLTITRL